MYRKVEVRKSIEVIKIEIAKMAIKKFAVLSRHKTKGRKIL